MFIGTLNVVFRKLRWKDWYYSGVPLADLELLLTLRREDFVRMFERRRLLRRIGEERKNCFEESGVHILTVKLNMIIALRVERVTMRKEVIKSSSYLKETRRYTKKQFLIKRRKVIIADHSAWSKLGLYVGSTETDRGC